MCVCVYLSEKPECPVHPTELVFVLDQSRDVTEQDFERMKGMMVSLVRDVKVRRPVALWVHVLPSYPITPIPGTSSASQIPTGRTNCSGKLKLFLMRDPLTAGILAKP